MNEPTTSAVTAEDQTEPPPRPRSGRREVVIAVGLFALTCLSTLWVGRSWAGEPDGPLWSGWSFALPLMAILLAHEMGHYVAGRIHGIDISPPFFIPLPLLLGTMGAVIQMRETIRRRNALLDVGAAGPLAGMAVALPILAYGLHISPVEALSTHAEEAGVFVEGRGLLYWGFLYAIKGPIPAGHDIWLGPTAMAGWAGLLVTMINLVPVGQLDGGHVAYALLGPRQNRWSVWVHRSLPLVGLTVSLVYLIPAYLGGERGAELEGEALAGLHWVTWAIVLSVLMRFSGSGHPPTGDEPLSKARKAIAVMTLVLFGLLFMPSWIYVPG